MDKNNNKKSADKNAPAQNKSNTEFANEMDASVDKTKNCK